MSSSKETLRHSAAHLMAAAIQKLYPQAKFGVGPTVEDGFYYDIDLDSPLAPADLEKIEKEMEKLRNENLKFEREEMEIDEAVKLFKKLGQDYKVELLSDLKQHGTTVASEIYGNDSEQKKSNVKSSSSSADKHMSNVSIYKTGDFIDLCRGPHVKSTKDIAAFKLTKLAGAYWRGDEKNKMLTRIYGTAFATQPELDEHLAMLEEAKKRDHKILGPRLELFDFHETAPGMPYWLPKGLIVMNTLIDFWRQEHQKRGYQEIATPLINKKQLYVTSGHWDHYQENMFISETEEGETYALKPMNCPNAMVVYGLRKRSYRELPLRLSDTDTLHRFERSGTLNGLLRVRSFRQDDAHIFVTPEQIKDEVERIFEITETFYSLFNMEYSFRLGTRPEKFMGQAKVWDRAEKELEEILKKSKKKFTVLKGDGAFYGPKIDILMKDVLSREWQMGTIQLDFQIPLKFNLTYTDKDGAEKTPVAIHRVIYGSLERFMGILIEHYSGAFPAWLSPVQVALLPVSTDKHLKYCQKLSQELQDKGARVWIDDSSETVGKKIRNSEQQKIPFMLVVGDKELSGSKLSVRERGQQETAEMSTEELINKTKR